MLAALPEWLWRHQTLDDMFQIGLPVVEKMLRPILVYIFLVIVLRVFGKRELTNLNPFDFVVLLTLSNTVQNAIIGNDNSITGGLLGAFTLLLVNYLVVRFIFKHRRLDQLVEGSPTTLIENGQVSEKNMARELLTRAELTTVVHRQGFACLDDVDQCVLEPGGNFYVKGKDPGVDATRHGLVLQKIEELGKQIEELKALSRVNLKPEK